MQHFRSSGAKTRVFEACSWVTIKGAISSLSHQIWFERSVSFYAKGFFFRGSVSFLSEGVWGQRVIKSPQELIGFPRQGQKIAARPEKDSPRPESLENLPISTRNY